MHYEVTHVDPVGRQARLSPRSRWRSTPATPSKLVAEADKRGLKLGGAPDTFLGAGGQTARRLLDEGAIGRVIGGTAYVMSHGMEHWHPNPGFFYQPGGGPMFDVGVYYITTLVSLLGPVKTVTAMASKGFEDAPGHRRRPDEGQEASRSTTPTNINAILDFASGAQVTLGASWDVWKHGHGNPIELYGAEGSMLVPDPNFFAGKISLFRQAAATTPRSRRPAMPFGDAQLAMGGRRSRARTIACSALPTWSTRRPKDREPRCSGRFAAHVVEVMEAILVPPRASGASSRSSRASSGRRRSPRPTRSG